ncbi:STAS domain-containing protein [Streptomyces phaeoluteigriseus]
MLTVRMQHGDTAVAQLPEQVDYDNAALVRAHCEELVWQGCATLVLDASRVKHLDSSGISMLIAVSRVLGDRGGTLRIAALNAHYRGVWRLLGLDSLFPVAPTALAALRAAGRAALPGRPSRAARSEDPV